MCGHELYARGKYFFNFFRFCIVTVLSDLVTVLMKMHFLFSSQYEMTSKRYFVSVTFYINSLH